jgi:biopolymer transport protein ExbD
MRSDTDLDMTPMIDCTFLLLIFFTVGATIESPAAVELPPARYGTSVDPDQSAVITLAQSNEAGDAFIYLADGKNGPAVSGDDASQADQVRQYVEGLFTSGRTNVLIKAERSVLHRHVSRVAAAAAEVEGVTLHAAVLESD